MGFRNPITTATSVDTASGPPTSKSGGVRIYEQPENDGFTSGVVEWYSAVGGSATLTARPLVAPSGPDSFTTIGSRTRLTGVPSNAPAPYFDLNVERQPDFSYRSVFRPVADVLDLGAVARLLQTAGSGDYPAGFGTIVFQTVEVDPYDGFEIIPPANADSRWFCPIGQGGLYAVAGRAPVSSVNPGNVATARLLRNGVAIQGSLGDLLTQPTPAGSSSPTTDRVLVKLLPGDYLELQGFVSNQTWRTRVTSDGVAPTLTVERVA